MPNYTNLPERHYVDKARRLSLGGKDTDTYFDGETLETILDALEDLQAEGSVTTEKLADGAVVFSKIGSKQVGYAKLADDVTKLIPNKVIELSGYIGDTDSNNIIIQTQTTTNAACYTAMKDSSTVLKLTLHGCESSTLSGTEEAEITYWLPMILSTNIGQTTGLLSAKFGGIFPTSDSTNIEIDAQISITKTNATTYNFSFSGTFREVQTTLYKHYITIPTKGVYFELTNHDSTAYSTVADIPNFDHSIPISGGTLAGTSPNLYFQIYISATKNDNALLASAIPVEGITQTINFITASTEITDAVIQIL